MPQSVSKINTKMLLYLKMHQHVLNVVEAASGLTQVYDERFQILVFAVDKQSPVKL